MSAVIATCAKGHKWKAEKTIVMRSSESVGVVTLRVVDPPKCPKCEGEWMCTYTDSGRAA